MKPTNNIIMAIDLSSIQKGKQVRAPRIILLGVPKIGKSTFASGADKPIFIPIKQEEGIDDIDVDNFPTANSFQEVMDCMTILYKEDHDYQTVVIDSASALEPVIWQAVVDADPKGAKSIEEIGGGFGKGYTEAISRWRTLMDALDALRSQKNMASILIGHVTVKRFDDPLGDPFDQYQFDVNNKAAAALYRWADLVGFANTKSFVKKDDVGFGKTKNRGVDSGNGQRFLFTQKSPAFPAGGRGAYGNLPAEIPLTWQDFKAAVNNANQ